MNKKHTAIIAASCALLAALGGAADAQSQSSEEDGRAPIRPPKWLAGFGVGVINADVRVVESEVTVPDDLQIGDFQIELDDTFSVSSNSAAASVGYRVLPFLEVSGRGALVRSDTKTGVTLTGTPNGAFSDVFTSPISVSADAEDDASGYALGLAVNAFAPVVTLGSNMLAMTTSYNHVWNSLDDGDIEAEASKASVGFVYPVSADRRHIVYRVAGSYNWLTRTIERNVAFGRGDVSVSITQEYEDPWSAEFGVIIPMTDRVRFAISGSQQIGGETSGFASIIIPL